MADLSLRDRIILRLLAASDAKLTAADVDQATSLRQDLDISSLILITLASELEDELGIDIDDEELGRIQTIGDLFKAITGVGLVSCLGHDYSQVVRALQNGASGLRAMREWESLGLKSRVAGAILDVEAKFERSSIPRKLRPVIS